MARHVAFYNLDAIIAVGFRVNSARAIQFRQWATGVLRDFAIRGYVLDKERLKKGAFFTNEYFDNLLAEIREIRASERKFYQKITDIYATAMDEEIRRTNAAIEKHGEEPLSAPTLKHSWYLHPLAVLLHPHGCPTGKSPDGLRGRNSRTRHTADALRGHWQNQYVSLCDTQANCRYVVLYPCNSITSWNMYCDNVGNHGKLRLWNTSPPDGGIRANAPLGGACACEW